MGDSMIGLNLIVSDDLTIFGNVSIKGFIEICGRFILLKLFSLVFASITYISVVGKHDPYRYVRMRTHLLKKVPGKPSNA